MDANHLNFRQTKEKNLSAHRYRQKLKDEGIHFYVSQNEDIKASVVERFNRTLKTKMWKYFTHRVKYFHILVFSVLLTLR